MYVFLAWLGCPATSSPTDTGTTDTQTHDRQWWLACGDVYCKGYTGPFPGIPLCEDIGAVVGEACDDDTTDCDPVDDCNALVQCGSLDPRDDGCYYLNR